MFTFSECPPNELAVFVASVTHSIKESECRSNYRGGVGGEGQHHKMVDRIRLLTG